MQQRRSMRASLLAAAAFAVSLAAVPAFAATRIGNSNVFRVSDGASFSISLTPSAGAVGIHDVPPPKAVLNTTPSSPTAQYLKADDGGAVGYTLRGSNARWYAGAFTGSGTTGTLQRSAPVTADGTAYAGAYLSVGGSGTAPIGSESNNVRIDFYTPGTTPGAGAAIAQAKYVEVLWGSVSAGERLRFVADRAGDATNNTISGQDVLDAAAALGMGAGNQSSYYVSLNLADGYYISRGLFMLPVAGTSFEMAVTDYSLAQQAALPAGAAPAPLPALAGTFPGLLALAGPVGSRLRRRSRAAA